MGTNYKAALIPKKIRETIHGWGKQARKKRRHGVFDDSTIHTDTSTVLSIEEDDDNRSVEALPAAMEYVIAGNEVELQPADGATSPPSAVANETSSRAATPLLHHSASISTSASSFSFRLGKISRSSSLPTGRNRK